MWWCHPHLKCFYTLLSCPEPLTLALSWAHTHHGGAVALYPCRSDFIERVAGGAGLLRAARGQPGLRGTALEDRG